MSSLRRLTSVFAAVALAAGFARAQSSVVPVNPIPFGKAPVDYFSSEADDAVARLQGRLDAGEVRLDYDAKHGYLPALLEALDAPVESQTLVFSKTSINVRLIGPQTPRAIYFNDDIYIGFTPEVPGLEIAAIDPVKGAMLYELSQDSDAAPRFVRHDRCVVCHASTSSLDVPGLLLRSFVTDEQGAQRSGYSSITHDSPYENRWGGWYVTGRTGRLTHLGNLAGEAEHARRRREGSYRTNADDVSDWLETGDYLSPHSDVAALLALDHQTHATNLLIRLGYESRLGLSTEATLDKVVRYFLFLDEPPLTDDVRGTSGFAERFQRRGPRDKSGRSLRELDLSRRFLKRRLSYTIYSRAFAGLPPDVKTEFYRRLGNALHDADSPLPQQEREEIAQIVRHTKSDLPESW